MTREELKVALESGVTLEELGLTQEQVDAMLVEDVQPEPEVIDPPVADPVASVNVDLIAELNAKIAEISAEVVEKDAKIAELSGKLEGFEAHVGDLKAIAAEITVNRRTALGFQSTVDLTKFSTESLLAEYKDPKTLITTLIHHTPTYSTLNYQYIGFPNVKLLSSSFNAICYVGSF